MAKNLRVGHNVHCKLTADLGVLQRQGAGQIKRDDLFQVPSENLYPKRSTTGSGSAPTVQRPGRRDGNSTTQ